MSAVRELSSIEPERIIETVRRTWGYDQLRPLQAEAIAAGLEHRDSLVVMPTGGGKSLCYQVPPAIAGRTDVVVSPLISLMKDQVDGLRECGYPAVALHSGMSAEEIRDAEASILTGSQRLIFVAPERLFAGRFVSLLDRLDIRAFAIDEAHCISHWGHDFRPEYRQLAMLKQRFPRASIHAYTATATQRVRDDIAAQLRLSDPEVLIGTFDRPNLVYRVVPRVDAHQQALAVLQRHEGQAAIIYCISRKDTEEMSAWLRLKGVKAAHYHAGMDAGDRRRTQDAFAEEKLDVVVATVAFGMGIDRSDVRCVIHAAMPKSIEHYQQETGRAGRDGLEAECVLFYSGGDVAKWESIIGRRAEGAERTEGLIDSAVELLRHMRDLAAGGRCRHRALSEYFGQALEAENCAACDICLGEIDEVPDSTVMAQKILSCVARVEQRFGAGHVADVLLGASTENIRSFGHERLSTYGLLKGVDKKSLTNMIHQLVDHGALDRAAGERPILRLNAESWRVMRGERDIRLVKPKTGEVAKTRSEEVSWEGVDRGLFENLRGLRRTIADERGVPAYVVFGDATLRELARVRPGSLKSLIHVRGIGERKRAELGERFVDHIISYCGEHRLSLDAAMGSRTHSDTRVPGVEPHEQRLGASRRAAFEMFDKGSSIESVMAGLARARSTTLQYLVEYITHRLPERIDSWVDRESYRVVASAAVEVGTSPLKPIFEKLGGTVPYDTIRLVARHLETVGAPDWIALEANLPATGVKSAAAVR